MALGVRAQQGEDGIHTERRPNVGYRSRLGQEGNHVGGQSGMEQGLSRVRRVFMKKSSQVGSVRAQEG